MNGATQGFGGESYIIIRQGKGGLNNYKNSTVLNKKLITKINYVLLGFIKINFKWLAVILLKKLKDIIKYYLS